MTAFKIVVYVTGTFFLGSVTAVFYSATAFKNVILSRRTFLHFFISVLLSSVMSLEYAMTAV